MLIKRIKFALATVALALVSLGVNSAQIFVDIGYTNFCLVPQDTTPGLTVVLEECGAGIQPNRHWLLKNGKVELLIDGTSESSELCLDILNGEAKNGSSVQLVPCNATVTQKWLYRKNEMRSFGGSDMCLDVPGAEFFNGASVQIWDCNNSIAQRWYIN